MEKDLHPQMEMLFTRSEQLDSLTPPRSVYWAQHKVAEEGLEFEVTDHELNRHEFLSEGADVIIAWIKAMREAGVSWEVAFQAVLFKYDVLELRFQETNLLMGNGKTHEENYNATKDKAPKIDVYTPSIALKDHFDV